MTRYSLSFSEKLARIPPVAAFLLARPLRISGRMRQPMPFHPGFEAVHTASGLELGEFMRLTCSVTWADTAWKHVIPYLRACRADPEDREDFQHVCRLFRRQGVGDSLYFPYVRQRRSRLPLEDALPRIQILEDHIRALREVRT